MDYDDWFLYIAPFPLLLIVGTIVFRKHLVRRPLTAAAVLRSEGVESASAVNALGHMRAVFDLAERLAAKGVVVARCMADWAGFGCWSLELHIPAAPPAIDTGGEKIVKAFWDGMARILSFDSELTNLGREPRSDQRTYEMKLDKGTNPVDSAEEYLAGLLGRTEEAGIGSAAEDAIMSARGVCTFAERLAARGVVIAMLDCKCIAPGSWTLHLYNGDKTDRTNYPDYFAVRVAWSGSTRDLSIAVSPLRALSNPHEFQTELEQTLSPSDDPINIAEGYLCADTANAAGTASTS